LCDVDWPKRLLTTREVDAWREERRIDSVGRHG
jgi:hypothetical protein